MFNLDTAYAVFDPTGALLCARVGMRAATRRSDDGLSVVEGVEGLAASHGGPPGEFYPGQIAQEAPDGTIHFLNAQYDPAQVMTFVPLTVELWAQRIAPVMGAMPEGVRTTTQLQAFFVDSYLPDYWRTRDMLARKVSGADRPPVRPVGP